MAVQTQPCCCDCLWCAGVVPKQMQIDVTGMALFSPAKCGNCLTLNDTFIADLATEFVGEVPISGGGKIPGSFSCLWFHVFPSPICNFTQWLVGYSVFPPFDWRLQCDLVLGNLGGGDGIVFSKFFPEVGGARDGKPNCYDQANGTELTFAGYAGIGDTECDGANATIKITALPN